MSKPSRGSTSISQPSAGGRKSASSSSDEGLSGKGAPSSPMKRKLPTKTISSPSKIRKQREENIAFVLVAAELKNINGRVGNLPYTAILAIRRRTGELVIRNATAWMNENVDSKGATTLRKMKEHHAYTITGAAWSNSVHGLGGKMIDFEPATTISDLLSPIDTSFPDLNAALSTASTSIAALTGEHNKANVFMVGRVRDFLTIANSSLVGKIALYDASDRVVDVCIFTDQREFMTGLAAHHLLLIVGKVAVRNDATISLALTTGRKNFLSNIPAYIPPPMLEMQSVQLLQSLSAVNLPFGDLLHNRPETIIWQANKTLEIIEITGDYVNFHCPTCAKPLEIHTDLTSEPSRDVWACAECGNIEDENVVFKSRPTLKCIIDGHAIESAQVKEGFELLLLGKTCADIVESGTINETKNKMFLVSLGISKYKIIIVDFKAM